MDEGRAPVALGEAYNSGARAALAPLLAGDDGPIAFACSNDEVALAVTFAALGLGAAVPGDVRRELDELTETWSVHPRLAELLRDRLA